MAFRFTIAKADPDPKVTDWYQEPTPMTAPMLMSQLRVLFPDAIVSIERGNSADAKSPDAAAEEFKKLKE